MRGRSPAMVGQTSSMCAPRIVGPLGGQVVRVVLHERGAAGQTGPGHLEDPQQGRGLPVALAAEAVAVGHQPLDGEAGQLAQTAEVLEVGGEGAEPAVREELPQRRLDPRLVAHAVVPLSAGAQVGVPVVEVAVLLYQRVDGLVRDGVHDGDQVVDAPGVDRHAEADLGLDLVPLGHGDVAHVVAEPGQFQRPRAAAAPAAARAHDADPGTHPGVGDVAGDRRPRHAAAGSAGSRTPGRRGRPG